MDSFDIFHRTQIPYNINSAEGCFLGSREGLYQKKIGPLRERVSEIVFNFLSFFYFVELCSKWETFTVISCVNLAACLLSTYLLIDNLKLLSFWIGKGNPRKTAPPRPFSKKSDSMFSSKKLLLLVCLQELRTNYHTQDLYSWFCSVLLASAVHLIFMEKLRIARHELRGRFLFKLVLVLARSRFEGPLDVLITFSKIYAGYLTILNLTMAFNRLVREDYSKRDILVKWSDQMYSVLNSVPYPIIIFDLKSVLTLNETEEKDKNVPVVFFNLAADRFFQNDHQDHFVSFLNLLDPQDEGCFIESVDELSRNREKQVHFTTEVPKEVMKSEKKRKFDVTMWKTAWLDREVVAAIFNNDAYSSKVSSNRFSSQSKEALNIILRQSSDSVETIISNIKSFNLSQLDQATFVSQLKLNLLDLACTKLLVDNYILNDFPDTLEVFNMKYLVLNTTDWISKEFRIKGIKLSLMFSRDFPVLVGTKLNSFRLFFFDLFTYLSRKLTNGKVEVFCDLEKYDEGVEEEDQDIAFLKFSFTIQSLREVDLPPQDFLLWGPTQTRTYHQYSEEGKGYEQLVGWLGVLKDSLGMRVAAERLDTGNSDNGLVYLYVYE